MRWMILNFEVKTTKGNFTKNQRVAALHHIILKVRGIKLQIHWTFVPFVVFVVSIFLWRIIPARLIAIGFNFILTCVNRVQLRLNFF